MNVYGLYLFLLAGHFFLQNVIQEMCYEITSGLVVGRDSQVGQRSVCVYTILGCFLSNEAWSNTNLKTLMDCL